MSAPDRKAVFLSYASQDAEAAKRLCDTLRAAGVEVWFDQSELRGGDSWDRKIRRQIKECALFIPVISAHTQAREEGYFRIEWELAAERAMGIAAEVAFILPIAIDDIAESVALVPDRFLRVQWMRAPQGELAPELTLRFARLWSDRTGAQKPSRESAEGSRPPVRTATRGLAAILFTDVVGYSARMQRDEARTLAAVAADFALMRGRCAQHGGEVLNSMGDGLLMCFPSAVHAVTCALQIQAEFGERAAREGEPEPLAHRMGVHIGDVIRAEGGVAGDGVNIAARLEGKAPPGGICISQIVHETVKGKVPMQAVFLGPESFKNITEPMPIWHIAPERSATLTRPPQSAKAPAATPVRARRTAVALAALGVVLVLAAWWLWRPGKAPFAAVRDDKSIAVLPFANMSDDKENAYFADGMHEDVLTNLANLRALRVISRTSTIQYRDTKKSTVQIARELGVAYILEGSVRRSGNTVRVTGQLIRAATDDHVWAKTYDRPLQDVFAVQTELAREIAGALHAVLSPEESSKLAERPTKSVEAYDCFQQARLLNRSMADASLVNAKVIPLLERAVALDPDYAAAWAYLVEMNLALYHTSDLSPARLARARVAMTQAERLAPDSYLVLAVGAMFDSSTGNRAGSEARRQRIKALFSHRAESHLIVADDAMRDGKWLDAQVSFQAALKLDPLNPEVLENYFGMLDAMRRWDEAESVARKLIEIQPDNLDARLMVASMDFRRTGSAERLKQLEAELPPTAEAPGGNIVVRSRIAFLLGDWPGLAALWREAGPRFRTGSFSARGARLLAAGAFLKIGDRTSARPLLEQTREELREALRADPDNIARHIELGVTLGMLGDVAGARVAVHRAGELIAANNMVPPRAFTLRWEYTMARSWVDDKADVIRELGRLLREPSNRPAFANVHVLKVSWATIPLHGDPEFEAMLADPKNNAPLF